jgi:hypothetical protein
LGYKLKYGTEYNKPYGNDHSNSVALLADVGNKMGKGVFVDAGIGLEKRLFTGEQRSYYIMPYWKADLTNKEFGYKNIGIELGVNFK